MPIAFAKIGDIVRVIRITGSDEVRQHLAELGFNVGAVVTIVSTNGSSIIVSVKNVRIALDKTMTGRIFVTAPEKNVVADEKAAHTPLVNGKHSGAEA